MVVCGGGVVVLCVAVMLARDGQEVTVLETDPDGAPATPPRPGRRGGAPASRSSTSRTSPSPGSGVSEVELPGLLDRLVAAGGAWVDLLETPHPVGHRRRRRLTEGFADLAYFQPQVPPALRSDFLREAQGTC